ncbi:MAG: hypothetical protein QOF26_2244, partial [Baekduia sp.]|nr:hypothetical protein [Baekduia sp.]
GYGEKWGLGSGLLLSAVGVLIWLLVPAKPHSAWKQRRKPQQDDRSSSTV